LQQTLRYGLPHPNVVAIGLARNYSQRNRHGKPQPPLTATNFVANNLVCNVPSWRRPAVRVVDAIAEWFEIAGYTKYFGYAGGSIWPFLDALTAKLNTLDGIQAKQESHAVHMADMYYRVTGKIAPVLINKGPGLLNAVGAAASAMHDSAPVLIIAGGGTTHFMGKAGMQEIFYHGFEDAVSVFKPVTKGTWMIIRPDSVIE